jgi:hypothetical protein
MRSILGRRKDRPRCGAKTRAGGACLARVEPGKARCRFHGGSSTGPKTAIGRARIASTTAAVAHIRREPPQAFLLMEPRGCTPFRLSARYPYGEHRGIVCPKAMRAISGLCAL